MYIDFKDPIDGLSTYKTRDYRNKFDKLLTCLFDTPKYLVDILTFFESWRVKNYTVTEAILRDLRKGLSDTNENHNRLLCDTLHEFQTMTHWPISLRRNVVSAFIEYMVFKKMKDNYIADGNHKIYGYDLLVYIQDKLIDNKRIDVGVIICCTPDETYQIFECKSFPQDITDSDMLRKIQFLQKVKNKSDELNLAGELFVLTLHDPSDMEIFGITQDMYPEITILDRRGIVEQILSRQPLCNCKAQSGIGNWD